MFNISVARDANAVPPILLVVINFLAPISNFVKEDCNVSCKSLYSSNVFFPSILLKA
jgi:hypothetical protein